ncbi:MAG TPA: nucleotidyl transferase AbiEii/AbiGii toxin family protein [Polyangiaceae bacterium]|nr:nucleotidyl transferase AbiEii/AbiGii toxin family protein [Polyangiaceae bacterium]
MTEPAPELALSAICSALRSRQRAFALVGGLAVSVRSEIRFTRDVDVAVGVSDDRDAEGLVHDLRSAGYLPVASVEHETRQRLSTIRLMSPQRVKIDLLFASSGIEAEIIARSTPVDMGSAGMVPVANAEELLAMKVLSMSENRLQDRLDAIRLLEFAPELDLDVVRDELRRITELGFHREQDLNAKLESVLVASERDTEA